MLQLEEEGVEFGLRCRSATPMRALKRTTEPAAFGRGTVWVRSGTVWVRVTPAASLHRSPTFYNTVRRHFVPRHFVPGHILSRDNMSRLKSFLKAVMGVHRRDILSRYQLLGATFCPGTNFLATNGTVWQL